MGTLLVIIAGPLAAAVIGYLMFASVSKRRTMIRESMQAFESELEKKTALRKEVEELYSSMVDLGSAQKIALEIKGVREALKAERGRIMITQAELETVESRLRELEEIERELEASGIETKQELNILKKKHAELDERNKHLKDQLSFSLQQLEQLMAEVEMSSQIAEQIDVMRINVVNTQEKIGVLLMQIEQGNDQYFILKKRYDALDIEYAQLYEKFSESDSSGKAEAL